MVEHARNFLAIGDSITNGCSPDLIVDGIPPRSWVQWLADAAAADLTVHARPGASTSTIAALLPDDAARYDSAFIYAGVNNVLSWRWWRRDDLAADLTRIITYAEARADRVHVVQLPDSLGRTRTIPSYGPLLRHRLTRAQAIIRAVVAGTSATLLTPPAFADGDIWVDGVHPTSSGHHLLATSVARQVGIGPLPILPPASPRPDFAPWRAAWTARFFATQPARGVGVWIFGR